MRNLKDLTVIMLLAATLACSEKGALSSEPVMRLFFIVPFEIETYSGITEHNIEEEGRAVWFMFSTPFIQELVSLLEANPSKMPNLNWIRVKVELTQSGEIYLVDRDGAVMKKSSGTTFRMNPAQVKSLEKRLADLVGAVDLKAHDLLLEKKEPPTGERQK